jgi:hypothetical protein
LNKKEVLDIIDEGWILKPKGYRVHFQKRVDDGWLTVIAPDNEKDLYDSDVVAWRIAWKLSRAGQTQEGEPHIVNVYVVNDAGDRIRYYATGDFHVYNPLNES